jgi:hypothetical protein
MSKSGFAFGMHSDKKNSLVTKCFHIVFLALVCFFTLLQGILGVGQPHVQRDDEEGSGAEESGG